MTPPRLTLIAAPFGGSTPDEVAFNLRRAVALARLATDAGDLPILPHLLAPMVYGPELAAGDLDVTADALERFDHLVRTFAGLLLARLWVLDPDSGPASNVAAARRTWSQGRGAPLMSGTWPDWRGRFRSAGLEAIWSGLERFQETRPAGVQVALLAGELAGGLGNFKPTLEPRAPFGWGVGLMDPDVAGQVDALEAAAARGGPRR